MSTLSPKSLPSPVSPAAIENGPPDQPAIKKRKIRTQFVGGLACCEASRALVSPLRPADNFSFDDPSGVSLSIFTRLKAVSFPVLAAAAPGSRPDIPTIKTQDIGSQFVGGLACSDTSRALVSPLRPAGNFSFDAPSGVCRSIFTRLKAVTFPALAAAAPGSRPDLPTIKTQDTGSQFVGGLACSNTSRALVSPLRPADNFSFDDPSGVSLSIFTRSKAVTFPVLAAAAPGSFSGHPAIEKQNTRALPAGADRTHRQLSIGEEVTI